MRKIISLMLALLLVLSLAACGSTNEGGNTDTPTSTPSTDNRPEIDSGDDGPQIEVEPREFKKTATIEETVLVDENGVKITAKELTYGNYAAELTLVIENNSDKDLSFIANSIGYSCNSINGYMVPDLWLSNFLRFPNR